MGRLQVWAAVLLLLASPFEAFAQSAALDIGAPMPKPASGAARSGRTVEAPAASGAGLARYAGALAGLASEGRPATRGAKEAQVYQQASPSVVLVLAKDSFGSGALISADGLIITNQHVVGDAGEVGVVFKPAVEGAEIGKADVRRAKVIRRDEIADLALLKVSEVPPGVKPLKVGGVADVQVGADVHAIGHPTGEAWTYTRGIVSQIRKDYVWSGDRGKTENKATVIQTQTPINPGNSGGPLLDDSLTIVGVNSFKSDGEGLNFAVSGDDVKTFLAAKSDRLFAGSPARKNKVAAANTCESKALEEWEVKEDPAGTAYLVDVDCDDKGDFVMIEPKSKKAPIRYLFDDDRDGQIDEVVFDENHDGEFDYALYDTDGDGKPDLQGAFKPGEDEPYRYEKITR